MFVALRNPMFLMFTLLSPVMLISNVVSDRRQGRKSYRRQLTDYRQALAAATKLLTRAAALERELRRYDAPDPATVLVTALGPRRRLWERRRVDQDRLRLRLGLARLRSAIEVTGGTRGEDPQPPMLDDVPVTVALGEVGGVLGVAGPYAEAHATARWLIAQAAVLHSPRDLSIVVLSDERGRADWGWTRWLPHARPEARDCVALTGSTSDVTARRVSELAGLVQQRQAQATGGSRRLEESETALTLVVLDGARRLRSLPGMPQVLRDGPAVGVYAICLDAEERLLPEECAAVASYLPGEPSRMTVRRAFGATVDGVLADRVSVAWAERVARAMTAIRDVSRDEADSGLPQSLRLLDVLGLEPPTAEAVLAGWDRGGRSASTPLGASTEGHFSIDLTTDGPHALIAGTTGAGKSELLQTLVAGLATTNRPDTMTFLLVDYKGGAAFTDCTHLPHTIGMVTDLNPHLTQRALHSLTAELKRRETLLAAANTKDITDYWHTHPTPTDPLPRLLLIIDEFATLTEELPDFVTGLLAIAQRGRSLGIHLILATQRPTGVISPAIRANTNLRIALRVTDNTESTDIIDTPHAAHINKTTPGRGYLRVVGGAPTEFQVARVGGRPTPITLGPPTVALAPWRSFGSPQPAAEPAAKDGPTDLQRLVSAIRAAAAVRRLAPPPSPWLPPLPPLVTLDDLDGHAGVARAGPPGACPLVPLGLADHPAEQRQEVFGLDIASGGLLIAGGPRSGRSTALRTLAGSVARHWSVDDVHLYALDCGSGALHRLADLPHCGAVVRRDEVARGDRVLVLLLDEVRRRQELLARAGFGSVAEQRAAVPAAERLPWLLLLVDGWEGFAAGYEAVDHGRPVATLLGLAREGPAVGLKLAVTSDRQGLLSRLAAAFPEKLLLQLADRLDYGLAGIPARAVPQTMPAGRGLLAAGAVEVQIALLDGQASGPAQAAALARVAAAASDRTAADPPRRRPFRVNALPRLVRLADLRGRAGDDQALGLDGALCGEAAPAGRPTLRSPFWTLVGVGGDEAGPVGVDLARDGPGFLVAGPRRSGRSTALATLACGLRASGTPVLFVAPARSPLQSPPCRTGAVAMLRPEDGQALLAALAAQPVAVIVDDVTTLLDSPVDQALAEMLRSGGGGHVVVVAGRTDELATTFRGTAAEVRRCRAGLLLCPSWTDGDLLGARLPRGDPESTPGRGVLVGGDRQTPVQVAVTEARPGEGTDQAMWG